MYKRVNINKEYVQSIEDELIILDDYIPMKVNEFTTEGRIKRGEFLKEKHPEIRAKMKQQRIKFKSFRNNKEALNFLYEDVKKFVDKYPQWSEIIESADSI